MTDQFTDQTGYDVGFVNVPQNILFELRILGVDLTESLLAPTLQTSLQMQDTIHTNPVKILDWFKESTVQIDCYRKVNESYSTVSTMSVAQTIFRLENRVMTNPSTEVYTLQACDPSLLVNAARRVSKSWECAAPDQIVKDVLTKCVQAKNVETEEGGPPRTYFAENIKPFQVVAQQADTALAGGDDPSFMHYMTYENYGTHHFRSLYNLTKQPASYDFIYSEKGTAALYGNPHQIITYEFPCDFDKLSDILNADGDNEASMFMINPFNGVRSMLGNQTTDCGMGGALSSESFTDKGSNNKCELQTEKYALKRQARMGLLDQDKIALRMTVPFNPGLHVGQMINVEFPNVPTDKNFITKDYGSGDYLIVTMTHSLKAGGFATTTLDCVSRTVGQGIV